MENRSFEADTNSKYRFSFNGKERDDEVNGTGNSIDYGDRILDTRLGRWLGVDRAAGLYPGVSPYNFCLNSPVLYNDPNGKWVEVTTTKYYRDKSGNLKVKKWYNIFKKTVEIHKDIVVGDIRFINASWTHEGVKNDDHRVPIEMDEATKQQIVSNFITSLVTTFDANTVSPDGKIIITTCLRVEGEAKFINDLSELKGNEELVVVGDFQLTENSASGLTFNANKSLMVIDESDALNPKSGTNTHEFGHQRAPDLLNVLLAIFNKKTADGGYWDHKGGGVFDDKSQKLNYQNAKSVKKDSKGIRKNSMSFSALKYHLKTLKTNKERLEKTNDKKS